MMPDHTKKKKSNRTCKLFTKVYSLLRCCVYIVYSINFLSLRHLCSLCYAGVIMQTWACQQFAPLSRWGGGPPSEMNNWRLHQMNINILLAHNKTKGNKSKANIIVLKCSFVLNRVETIRKFTLSRNHCAYLHSCTPSIPKKNLMF